MLFGLKIFGYMRSVLVYVESLNVVNSGAYVCIFHYSVLSVRQSRISRCSVSYI